MGKYYNKERKILYLDSKKKSKDNISNVFFKTKGFEEKFSKDACNFSLDEIEIMMEELETISVSVLKIMISVLQDYTDFCIKNGLKKSSILSENINFYKLANVETEKFRNFIDKNIRDNRYILPSDLKSKLCTLRNSSDKVLVQLLWEGFSGAQLCEIRYLKHDDVNYDKKYINVRNEENKVTGIRYCSEDLLRYIKESEDDYLYYPAEGKSLRGVMHIDTSSSLVIKPTIKKNSNKFHTMHSLYRRFNASTEQMGLDYLKINTIGMSYPLYLGLSIKNIFPDALLDSSKFYMFLSSVYYGHKAISGAFVMHRIEENILSGNINKIEKDVLIPMIKNAQSLFEWGDKYFEMILEKLKGEII